MALVRGGPARAESALGATYRRGAVTLSDEGPCFALLPARSMDGATCLPCVRRAAGPAVAAQTLSMRFRGFRLAGDHG
jgi:hypothetical protein